MSALDGIVAGGGYIAVELTTAGDTALVVAELNKILAVIPDPDNAPANSGVNELDEMAPVCAACVRVEIIAMRDLIADA